ncbi:MAG: twin-arginine translocase TatA/TatE family subunit [Thaumarchaeota archaeon]|nr:twin-arginine translocase TatA/TatE family subunit [Nitrososphaerota archaeon]
MPIHGLEWLFITLIVIVLVLTDPEKIPQIARALAQAKKEYEEATSTVQEFIEEVQKGAENMGDSDETLIKLARELGIETYGKTREEIKNEILKKAGKSGENQEPVEPENAAEKTEPKAESAEEESG